MQPFLLIHCLKYRQNCNTGRFHIPVFQIANKAPLETDYCITTKSGSVKLVPDTGAGQQDMVIQSYMFANNSLSHG